MKILKKTFLIIIFNLLFAALLLFICDVFIYKDLKKDYNKNGPKEFQASEFKYLTKPNYCLNFETYFDGSDNIFKGRKPDGTEYKTNNPIIVFGCSYALGQFLNYNQTFSYKLAHFLKHPVYNRAISARGLAHMYWQTEDESFYKNVPSSDTIIYVMIDDHYRRMMVSFLDTLDLFRLRHYSITNNKLVADKLNNPLLNVLKSSYTIKLLNLKYAQNFINNQQNSDKLTDMALIYFLETRKQLEKRWNRKINFIVFLYEDKEIAYKEELSRKLKENNFTVISTKELTNDNLNEIKYKIPNNYHPTEAAWDLLTPKFIEKAFND